MLKIEGEAVPVNLCMCVLNVRELCTHIGVNVYIDRQTLFACVWSRFLTSDHRSENFKGPVL